VLGYADLRRRPLMNITAGGAGGLLSLSQSPAARHYYATPHADLHRAEPSDESLRECHLESLRLRDIPAGVKQSTE
ncbi:unnamed protein product, partial [Mycena citricolor]